MQDATCPTRSPRLRWFPCTKQIVFHYPVIYLNQISPMLFSTVSRFLKPASLPQSVGLARRPVAAGSRVPHGLLTLLFVWASLAAHAQTTISQTFAYNGTNGTDGSVQTYVVPAGVTQLMVSALGAAGANGFSGFGGKGGQVDAVLAVIPGQTLSIYVGGSPPTGSFAGYNGGGGGASGPGDFDSGGGGGATDIRLGGNALTNRVIVAGGGGGGGASGALASGGGGGGGTTGQAGQGGSGTGGGGGSQSVGRPGGSGPTPGNAGSGATGGNSVASGSLRSLIL